MELDSPLADKASPLTDKASLLTDKASRLTNEPHDFDSLSNCGKSFEQCGKKPSPQESSSGAYTVLRGSVSTLNTLLIPEFQYCLLV